MHVNHSVEFNTGVDFGNGKVERKHGNCDRSIHPRDHLGSRKLACATDKHPSLDLILSKNEVPSKVGEAQILGRLVAKIDRRRGIPRTVCSAARALEASGTA